MKALVKKFRKTGLWLEEVPLPTITESDVLIKVHKTSICGTDVHIYNWDDWAQKTIPVPMVVGHEFMGEIVEVGRKVNGLHVGDRVSGEGHITCGQCPPCREGKKHLCMNTIGVGVNRQGCFAEYLSLPAENVFVLPAGIQEDVVSIMDPFGNAVHTALSFDLVGEDVLITGAGPIGIMAAAVAKKAGARRVVVTDINDYRLELAKKMGATHTVNVMRTPLQEKLDEIGVHFGFTVGLEMSGSPQALQTMTETMRNGGKIALLGILPAHTVIDWNLVIFKMLVIKGIYGREIFSTWHKMVHLLESGLDLSPVITHKFAFEEFEKGFAAMLSGQSGKVVLSF